MEDDFSRWVTGEQVEEMRKRSEEQVQAFILASHSRLGADSWLGKLDPELMESWSILSLRVT